MPLTELPLGLPGRVYRSPMPYSLYDPNGAVLKAYLTHQVDVVVQLVSDEEALQRSGKDLRRLYAAQGIEVLFLPIPDFGVPDKNQFTKTLSAALEAARSARNLAVHCNAGIGRTGLFLACLAAKVLHLNGEEAVQWVRKSIRGAVEMPEQIEFVQDFIGDRG